MEKGETETAKRPRTGLVLEGGGLRGMFTNGILDTLMEEGVTFDGTIGVSAGALFGCNFKSHQIGRALRYNIKYKDDRRYISFYSFLTSGNLVNTEFAYRTLPYELDVFDKAAFKANPMEFWLVCTDVLTGEPVYHRMDEVNDEEMDWMRASGSMPVVSKPVEMGGRLLLDGGMTDAIPLKAFQQMGYDKNIVILTQPQSYLKKRTKLVPVFKLFSRKYPKVAEIMARRHDMYNAELEYIAQQARLGNTMLIYPDAPLAIGRVELDEKKMRAVYALGKEKARSMMKDIKDFLATSDTK